MYLLKRTLLPGHLLLCHMLGMLLLPQLGDWRLCHVKEYTLLKEYTTSPYSGAGVLSIREVPEELADALVVLRH